MTRLTVDVPDVPAVWPHTSRISAEKGNIREVIDQRAFYDTPIGIARVEFIVETLLARTRPTNEDALAQDGYKVERSASTSSAQH